MEKSAPPQRFTVINPTEIIQVPDSPTVPCDNETKVVVQEQDKGVPTNLFNNVLAQDELEKYVRKQVEDMLKRDAEEYSDQAVEKAAVSIVPAVSQWCARRIQRKCHTQQDTLRRYLALINDEEMKAVASAFELVLTTELPIYFATELQRSMAGIRDVMPTVETANRRDW